MAENAPNDETTDWCKYFDDVQLGIALTVLRNKPGSISSYEYARQIQNEVARQMKEANSNETDELKKIVGEANERIASLENEVHRLESEVVVKNAVGMLLQFQAPEGPLPAYNFTSKLNLLKQLLFVRTLYNISQNCSPEYFSNLLSKLSTYSIRTEVSYYSMRSFRKHIYSKSTETLLESVLKTVVKSCVDDKEGFDEKFEAVRILVLLADSEDCLGTEELREKLIEAVGSLSELVLQSSQSSQALHICDIISSCTKIQLDVVRMTLKTVKSTSQDLKLETDPGFPFAKALLAKRLSLLLSLCERVLRKIILGLSISPTKIQVEQEDILLSWTRILHLKSRQERLCSETKKVSEVYLDLKESVKEITGLIPSNMALLVVILAKCDGHLETCLKLIEKGYRNK